MTRARRTTTGARLALVASSILAGACVPSTFDDLTGGAEEKPPEQISPRSEDRLAHDPSIEAPRPIAPLSASWVNTLRPVFRWESKPDLLGAVIELSRSRADFEQNIEHRFVATGRQLEVPVDLAPGFWFWRVRGRTEVAEGDPRPNPHDARESLIWELLVRGPSAGGASPIAMGAVHDRNSDGNPDLLIQSTELVVFDEEPEPTPLPSVLVAFGDKNGSFNLSTEAASTYLGLRAETAIGVSLSGGVDVDGDGYSDFAVGHMTKDEIDPSFVYPFAQIWFGSKDGRQKDRDYVEGPLFIPVEGQVAPGVEAAGDVNGDGYGDIGLSLPFVTSAVLGAPKGTDGFMRPLIPDQWSPVAPAEAIARVAVADFDGDGVHDLAANVSPGPLTVAFVSRERVSMLRPLTTGVGLESKVSRASSILAADFDGDSKPDLAFVADLDAGQVLCFAEPNGAPVTLDDCWASPEPFAGEPILGDIDGDGRDDVIIAAADGIHEVHFSGRDKAPGERVVETLIRPASEGLGTVLTMIYPGRPGPMTWAAMNADGTKITVLHGRDVNHSLDIATSFSIKFGPRIR